MKVHLGYYLAFAALALAICAGFFSVYGLSQMFAGAAISVIVMASTLELSKLIIATYLHNYWEKMSKLIRIYLTTGLIVLAVITSLGIYGYLSNAYQITANKVELFDGDLAVYNSKIQQYESKIASNDKILESKNKRIEQLMNIRDKQEDRLDASNSKSNRQSAANTSSDINQLNKEIDELNNVSGAYNDSISKLRTVILEKKSTNEVAGEVGTLKYMSEITGLEMSQVVNIFILLLIFVFDPLAICLVIATNNVFSLKGQETKNKKEAQTKTDDIVEVIKEETTNGVDFSDTNELVDKMVEVINEPKKEIPKVQINDELVSEQPIVEPIIETISEPIKTDKVEEPIVEPTPLTIKPSVEKTVEQTKTVEQPTRTPIKYENIKEIRDREKNKVDRGFSKAVPTRNVGGRIEKM